MRRLDFTPEALADLEQITAHISMDSPAAAVRVRARIYATLDGLTFMPTARFGRNAGTYEKPVRGLPYILAFELPDKATLRILRVIHGARDWPAGGWPGIVESRAGVPKSEARTTQHTRRYLRGLEDAMHSNIAV